MVIVLGLVAFINNYMIFFFSKCIFWWKAQWKYMGCTCFEEMASWAIWNFFKVVRLGCRRLWVFQNDFLVQDSWKENILLKPKPKIETNPYKIANTIHLYISSPNLPIQYIINTSPKFPLLNIIPSSQATIF